MREIDRLTAAVGQLRVDHAEVASRLVETREAALLQEAGIYQYRHPLDDSIAYKRGRPSPSSAARWTSG